MGEPFTKTNRRRNSPVRADDHPLLRALIGEATRRGDTLVQLAKQLGVSYRRVAQWRGHEANISNASREVFLAAGSYLRVPTVLVLCLAGVIQIEDLTVKSTDSQATSVERGLQRLMTDPLYAAFVPEEVLSAEMKVKAFILFMYREQSGASRYPDNAYGMFEWMRVLMLAMTQMLHSEQDFSASKGKNAKAD